MADFVLVTGLPPSAYWDSPREETNAVMAAWNRQQEAKNRQQKRRR